MATVAGMSWDVARHVYRQGFYAYQGAGPAAICPYRGPGDKRIGLWTAGKDAARRRESVEPAWARFRKREEAVL